MMLLWVPGVWAILVSSDFNVQLWFMRYGFLSKCFIKSIIMMEWERLIKYMHGYRKSCHMSK